MGSTRSLWPVSRPPQLSDSGRGQFLRPTSSSARNATLFHFPRAATRSFLWLLRNPPPPLTSSQTLARSEDASWRLWCRRKHLQVCGKSTNGRDEHAHLESASASHRAAAASLLYQQSELVSWRLRCRSQSVQVRGRGGRHSLSECQRQRRARTPRVRLRLSCTVQQPQACSTRVGACFHGGSSQCRSQSVQVRSRGGRHSSPECRRQRRARTPFLSPPPPRTVQQTQACSTSRSSMAAPVQTTITQPGRCVIAATDIRSLSEYCTPLESASASHLAAAASLPSKSELHGGSGTDHNQCRCAVAVTRQSSPESKRHRRARTPSLSLPQPRIVQQPQACSTSRSFMAAPV